MSDSELIDLVPFLETLSKVDNVYTVLRSCNNPLNQSSVAQYQTEQMIPVTHVVGTQPITKTLNGTYPEITQSPQHPSITAYPKAPTYTYSDNIS